jgi:DNA-binding response OmpR family regulator
MEPLRICIVENHADTLAGLSIFLQGKGHSVSTACDCASALEIARTRDFDVVISDLGLPDGNGWELIRRIREIRPVRAIAMSGYGADSDRGKSADAGFQMHLVKPFTPRELSDALREVMQREPVA